MIGELLLGDGPLGDTPVASNVMRYITTDGRPVFRYSLSGIASDGEPIFGLAQVYNDAVAEAVAATDGAAAVLVAVGAIAETGSAADATSSAAVLVGAVGETGTATDSINGSTGGSAYSVSISETGTATDGVASLAVFGGMVSEAGAATDTALAVGVFPSSVAEVAALVDAFTGSVGSQTYTVSIAETASATASVSGDISVAGPHTGSTHAPRNQGNVMRPRQSNTRRP